MPEVSRGRSGNSWKIKALRVSELVARAMSEGPQLVTRNGKKAVVVVSPRNGSGASTAGAISSISSQTPLREEGRYRAADRLPARHRAVMRYLLDTNVVSELVKPRPDARVVA